MKKLFVGGLSWGTTDEGLHGAFSRFGEIVEAKVITDRETGRSRGFGFVTFSSDEGAARAITEMDGSNWTAARSRSTRPKTKGLAAVVAAVAAAATAGRRRSRRQGRRRTRRPARRWRRRRPLVVVRLPKRPFSSKPAAQVPPRAVRVCRPSKRDAATIGKLGRPAWAETSCVPVYDSVPVSIPIWRLLSITGSWA